MEQEERKRKEAFEIALRRREKEEKNLATKQKNEDLILERRKKLIEKYTHNEEKIKKQKDDNDKNIMNKHLDAANKREDTNDILSRYERLQELSRMRKVQQIEERNEKLEEMQRENERINTEKRILGNNLAERKKLLLSKVANILTTGNYKTKEDIYRKVFNDDELQALGYSMSKTISSHKSSNSKKLKSIKKALKTNKTDDGFFLTQGNSNTINGNKEQRMIIMAIYFKY